MYFEYCAYNKPIVDYVKEQTFLFKAIEDGLQGAALPIHFIREIISFIPEGFTLSVPIDYPLGLSSTKIREATVLEAAKSGATAIDYVPNNYLLLNKFKSLKQEIETVQRICDDYNLTLRIFNVEDNKKIQKELATIYYNMGITICFCSLGYHFNDPIDHLLDCKEISKTGINVIANAPINTEKHFEITYKSNLFGMRFYNPLFWCKKDKGQRDLIVG